MNRPGGRAASLLDVLDLPGTTRILVHAVSSVDLPSYRAIKGPLLHGFAERALLAARPRDVVCLTRAVDRAFLEHLARLGVGVAEDRIVVPEGGAVQSDRDLADRLAGDAAALARIRALVAPGDALALEPFLASSRELHLARTLERVLGRPVAVVGGREEAVARANRKHWIREQAVALGIPVAPGEVVDLGDAAAPSPVARARLEAAVGRWLRPTGAAILRGDRGAGGSSTLVVRARSGTPGSGHGTGFAPGDAIDRALAPGENRLVLVESLLPFTVSPNLLVHLPEAGPVRCVGASDQRLDEHLTHRGNSAPSRARTLPAMVRHAERLGGRLREEGCRGVIGIDFLEVPDPAGTPRALLVEVNPRVNGALYPTALLEALARRAAAHGSPIPRAYVSAGLAVPPQSYEALAERAASLLLAPGAPRGVLPYHTGGLRHGKLFAVAIAARLPEAEALLEALAGIAQRGLPRSRISP